MRTIPDVCVAFVAKWEAPGGKPKLKAYLDSAGIPTLGFGHIEGVKMGDTCTAAQAFEWLRSDMSDARAKLYRKVGPIVEELTENQYSALLSFAFNLGTGNPKKPEWQMWKLLRARSFDQIHAQFGKFVNATDPATGKLVKVQGLVNRRAAESALWATDEPGTEVIKFTSAQLRSSPTPPTPADPTPASKSLTIWGAISAAVLGFLNWVGGLLSQVPDFAHTALNAINPFAEKSELAQTIANGVGGLAAVAGLYVAWSVVKKKKESRS